MDLSIGFETKQTATVSARLISFTTGRALQSNHGGTTARRWAFRSVRSGKPGPTLTPTKYSPALEAALRSGRMIDEEEFGLCSSRSAENTAQPLELSRSMRVASSGPWARDASEVETTEVLPSPATG